LLRCQRLSGFVGILGALVDDLFAAGGADGECVAVDGEKGGFFGGMLNS
jgi:hypothetical protein